MLEPVQTIGDSSSELFLICNLNFKLQKLHHKLEDSFSVLHLTSKMLQTLNRSSCKLTVRLSQYIEKSPDSKLLQLDLFVFSSFVFPVLPIDFEFCHCDIGLGNFFDGQLQSVDTVCMLCVQQKYQHNASVHQTNSDSTALLQRENVYVV